MNNCPYRGADEFWTTIPLPPSQLAGRCFSENLQSLATSAASVMMVFHSTEASGTSSLGPAQRGWIDTVLLMLPEEVDQHQLGRPWSEVWSAVRANASTPNAEAAFVLRLNQHVIDNGQPSYREVRELRPSSSAVTKLLDPQAVP